MSLDDLSERGSDEEVAALFRAVGKVARLTGASEAGYRILANIGENGRQEVPHFHVHIFGGKRLGRMLPGD